MHYAAGEGVELGGLVSYGVNLPDLSRATAIYLARILKGAKPAEFGVHMCVGQLLARRISRRPSPISEPAVSRS
jgi:ABC-type uncharacterized transport system substrate-binding protein